MTSKLQQLIDLHSALLEQNPYCYFELAYTKTTGWMAWICSKPSTDDPQRKVLAQGQGETPEQAADWALESFGDASGVSQASKGLNQDYEYATTTGPRKAFDDTVPPPGEGWERNTDVGNHGFERFEYHEEAYWRRRKQTAA